MGKKDKKTAKGRLDKYYHLAKEQGYRARSAFKLIQLNKKYNFLEKSRCLIDLCAAPGGWLQVASKYMPVSSLIIGVDLVPIKPIPKVITLQEDITTDKCRARLRNELKSWKADVFLHDGAPNVGISWAQDAFSQSELTLKALKLAVEFLNEGGTFITKIFRSKDYNNLIWVFNQLFKKVEATKPASSRNVSAEIYVICRDYLAPKKIDPKFLDSRSVFQDVDIGPTSKSVLEPGKNKRNREGYEDGVYTLYKESSIFEFINSDDPVKILGSTSKLKFDTDEAHKLLNHESTTEEIKACCEDLKVLGKREFKSLLKWRKNIIESLKEPAKEDVKETTEEEKINENEKIDEDEAIQEELDRLVQEEQTRRKQLRRKINEKRQKNVTRMQLKMISPTDIVLDDNSLFDLKKVDKNGILSKMRKGNMDIILDQDDEKNEYMFIDQHEDTESVNENDDDITHLEKELDELYEQYQERKAERDAKYRVKKLRAQENDQDDVQSNGFKDDSDTEENVMSQSDEYSSSSDNKKDVENIKIPGDLSKKAAVFFDQPLFKDFGQENDPEQSINGDNGLKCKMKTDEKVVDTKSQDVEGEDKSRSLKRKADEIDQEDEVEIVPLEKNDELWDANESDEDEKKMIRARENGLITAEAVTLAQQLVNRRKTKQELIDDGFRRYTFNDREGLPEWFLDDERKHNKPNLPITKEAVEAIRERMKALNARPIKKVAEAKAKKKFRAFKKLAKLQKKTNAIAETSEMTEGEKAQTISKLISKSQKKMKKEVKLVVAKGLSKGKKGRPKGVKGRYKMVDARMKKEARAMKRVDQKGKSKKRQKR
ncbi:1511_t:CDS:10 [Acaulospora morrowiae]|uniref:1511_t:CDS:1 n=1 Tax=Acaulospora morrowiae TaxID=94023 RepID=A0A9N9FPK9_9GLOM|nr:1511_t:CDS:10 [Acaulospora morrowiae]